MIDRRTFLQIAAKASWVLTVAVSAPGGFFFFTKDVIGAQRGHIDVHRFINRWDKFYVAEISLDEIPDEDLLKEVAVGFRRAMEKNGSTEIRNVQYEREWGIVEQGYIHTWKADIRREKKI